MFMIELLSKIIKPWMMIKNIDYRMMNNIAKTNSIGDVDTTKIDITVNIDDKLAKWKVASIVRIFFLIDEGGVDNTSKIVISGSIKLIHGIEAKLFDSDNFNQ